MTQAEIVAAIRIPKLVLKVAPAIFIRIVSFTPDDETLDPIIVYRPYEGGADTDLTLTEFLRNFPAAEVGLPEIRRNQVYQVAGGVRKEVLAAVSDEANQEVWLVLRSDDGSDAEEVAASAFLATKPELLALH